MANKKGIEGTGGGPFRETPLSQLEEEVSGLLQLEATVEGISDVVSWGFRTETEPSPSDTIQDNEESATPRQTSQESATPRQTGSRKRRPDVDSMELLRKQLSIQENLQKTIEKGLDTNNNNMTELISEMRKQRKCSERIYEVQKKAIDEQKRHHIEKEKLIIQQKIEIKKKC